jgi:hypothetical protein
MRFIGLDPGVSGGVAIIDDGDVRAYSMPTTPQELADLLRGLGSARTVCERVGAARGRDGRKQGVSSAFTFGVSYGTSLGVLAALRIPHELVTPAVWQKEFGLVASGNNNLTAKKNAHKAAAARLFPSLRIIHATADALLLAEWLRRRETRDAREAG